MQQTSVAANTHANPDSSTMGWLRRFAINDWVTLSYLLYLNGALLFAPASEAKTKSALALGSLLGTFVLLALVLARGNWPRLTWVQALAYRIGHFAGLQFSYLVFATFLPIVNSGALDHTLYDLDMALFGFEPAVLMDRFVTPATTEWFAFFYYSYFFIIAGHVFPILFFGKHQRLISEFALGLTLVICIGQGTYLLVPGFGPHHAFPSLFSNQIPEGLWWSLVTDLVHASGAQKDIFPSLHTAIPGFVLLFSFHNRALAPYRYTWQVLAFFTLNIIVATMFLRWHYLIDIIAGVALATLAHGASVVLIPWEARLRRSLGLGNVWPDYRTQVEEPTTLS